MKVHIGSKKENPNWLRGVTIYDDSGRSIYCDSSVLRDAGDGKFSRVLKTLLWGIKKVKLLGQSGDIREDEKIFLIIDSKTVYSWFEEGVAPEPYIDIFSDILMELSFIRNEVEIIYSQKLKVLFHKDTKSSSDYTKVTDLFKSGV